MERIRRHPAVAADAREELEEQLSQWFGGTAQHQLLRLVINDFHEFREERGWPPEPHRRVALDAYTQRLLAEPDAMNRIWEAAPRLQPKLTRLGAQALRAVDELLSRFLDDRTVLAGAGLVRDGDLIARVEFSRGDTHAEGRSVAVVTLSSGSKLVYKPRSLALDMHLPQIWALLDGDLRHSLSACVPVSLDRGGHGWQAFVERRADLDPDQCARYFYRFGALTALAGLWGATDLHHENVIVAGEIPTIIDSETVLQPDPGSADAPNPELDEALRSTPLGTLLLPLRDSASVVDVILSGLGVPWTQASNETVYQVADRDSDAFSVRRMEWSVTQNANVPFIDGTPQNPIDWFGELKAGYLDALAAIRAQENKIAEALRALPSETTIRYVFRATEVYGRFLDVLTHPKQLASEEAEEAVLAVLEPPRAAALAPEWLVESERRQLRVGDVPMFTSGVHETHTHGAGRSPRPVFVTSAAETAIRRTRTGLGLSDEFHLLLLETCCSELGRGPETRTVSDALFRPMLEHLTPEPWHERIGALALRTRSRDASPNWGWCGGTGLGGDTFDAGLSISFHDFGGPVAFLRRHLLATGRGRSAAEAARRGWLDRADSVDTMAKLPWSVLTGAASAPLVLGAEGMAILLSAAYGRQAAPEIAALDVTHGSAGLVALLSPLTLTEPTRAIVEEHASRVAQALAQPGEGIQPTQVRPDYDLLHGRLGLWWALLRAGRALGHGEWVEAALEGIDAAVRALPAGAPRGWCNGLAGLALVADEAGLPPGLVDGLLERAMALPLDGSVDLSVCHGEAGIAQVLARVEQNRGAAPERARAHLGNAFAAARARGFHNGAHGHTALLGYLLGWSGVADTVLLLQHPATLAVPVALEVDGAKTPTKVGAKCVHSALIPAGRFS